MTFLDKLLRYAAMAAIACTGIGILYLIAKTVWVRPNTMMIVDNYYSQEKEALKPGLHILLNPYIFGATEFSTQTQVTRLASFSAKSMDNVDARVEADFTYVIDDPKKFAIVLSNPQKTLQESVIAAFASAIQTLNFPEITSAEINNLLRLAGHNDQDQIDRNIQVNAAASASTHVNEAEVSANNQNFSLSSVSSGVNSSDYDLKDADHKAAMAKHGANFFRTILSQCNQWGVTIILFRIISIEAKHPGVSMALESVAKTEVEAKALRRAASSQAATIVTLAEAHKKAQLINAEAMSEAANIMQMTAAQVYELDTRVRAAEKLGKNSGLFVNAGAMPVFAASTTSEVTNNLTRKFS